MKANVRFFGREIISESVKGCERLAILGKYPDTSLERFAFSQFGPMHLVAAKLPRVIRADFFVALPMRQLIARMYASERRRAPHFDVRGSRPVDFGVMYPPSSGKIAIAYSGGKDSIWNLWRAEKKYGPANTLAAHIHGLNRANSSRY